MFGALEKAMDLAAHCAVGYAHQRVWFGRPISKFQAVQQNLAVLAGQKAPSVPAANLGIEASGKTSTDRELFLIAVANTRLRGGRDTRPRDRPARPWRDHFTKEYALQLSTGASAPDRRIRPRPRMGRSGWLICLRQPRRSVVGVADMRSNRTAPALHSSHASGAYIRNRILTQSTR